jgi:hypothetical protein
MWARANSCAMVAATSGKSFGPISDGCSGQVTLTLAGSWSGSTSSTVMVSWFDRLICVSANGVVDDGDKAELHSV